MSEQGSAYSRPETIEEYTQRIGELLPYMYADPYEADLERLLIANQRAAKMKDFALHMAKFVPYGISWSAEEYEREETLAPEERREEAEPPSEEVLPPAESVPQVLEPEPMPEESAPLPTLEEEEQADVISDVPEPLPADTADLEGSALREPAAEAEGIRPAEANNTLVNLTTTANEAREEYARLAAERGRRVFELDKKFSKQAIAKARKRYEDAGRALAQHEREMAIESGVDPAELDKYEYMFDVGDAERIADHLYQQRRLATGKYRINPESGALEEKKPNSFLGRTSNNFYKWWGRRQNSKLLSRYTVEKSAVMAGAGLAIGIPAGLVGAVLLGPIVGGAAGALAATKVSKSVMAYHLSRRSKDTLHVDELHYDLLEAADYGQAGSIGNVIDRQTNYEVAHNRRRLLGSFAVAAAGGLIGAVGIEHLFGIGGSHGGATGVHEHGKTTPTESHPQKTPSHYPSRSSEAHKSYSSTLRHRGDTIWSEVHRRLVQEGYNANDRNVWNVTSAVLHHQGISWEQARHLPIGYKFNILESQLEEAKSG
jgi:hypothetical protein